MYLPTEITDEILLKFRPTRLSIKRLAGIYYFCKSTKKDFHKYAGSGVKWKDRIKKYGKQNVETLWVSDWYNDPHELQMVALHFSYENRIVESDMWANINPENGLDGGYHSDQTIQKIVSTRKQNDSYGWSDQTRERHLETKIKNGTLNNQTPERVAKQLETRRKNGTLNPNTPESSVKRWETRRKNGKDKRTEDSKEKQKKTRVERGIVNNNTVKKTCPHCGKSIGLPNYAKYHGDKCKMRTQNGDEKEIS